MNADTESSGRSEAQKRTVANLRPWTKGQSGNPDGRPPGILNRSTIVRLWLEHDATDGHGGTKLDQIIRAQINGAEDGNTAAFQAVMDSAFGKLKEVREISGPDGGPIEQNVSQAPPTTDEIKAELERRGLPTTMFEE